MIYVSHMSTPEGPLLLLSCKCDRVFMIIIIIIVKIITVIIAIIIFTSPSH